MIRTDTEYRNALERLDQEAETMERQRAHLQQEMGLTEEQLERAMQPMISFRAQLEEEVGPTNPCAAATWEHFITSGVWDAGSSVPAPKRGWSAGDLADVLGVSAEQVSRDEL